MSIDAVAILRPKDPTKIRAHVDPDAPGTLLVPLADGTILFHSFMGYQWLEEEPNTVREWLTRTFGKDLPAVHDDARGVLVFPDVCEPRAQSYDAIVAEIESAGFWVPLDDTPAAADHAARAHAKKQGSEEAFASQTTNMMAKLQDLMSRSVDPGSPEAQALLGELQALAGPIMATSMDARDIACVIVGRKTPLRVAEREVNELIALADGSTIVFTVNLNDADDLSWRLAEQHAHWVAEHDDPRGVPMFGMTHLDKVRDASSYEHALETLGAAVTFLVPKGSDARDVERKAKLRAIVGPPAKKKTAKKTAKKKSAKPVAKKKRAKKRVR